MWAVFRYSTGRVLSYFTDERSAQDYVNDQNNQDRLILLNQNNIMYYPDWGYRLAHIEEVTNELASEL